MENSVAFEFPNNIGNLQIKGSLPISGSMVVDKTGKVEIAISNGKYCAKKGYEDSDVVLDENINDCNLTSDNKDKTIEDLKKKCVEGTGDIVWTPVPKYQGIHSPKESNNRYPKFYYSNNDYLLESDAVATKLDFTEIYVEPEFDYILISDWNKELIAVENGLKTINYILPGNEFNIKFLSDYGNNYFGYNINVYETNDCRAIDQIKKPIEKDRDALVIRPGQNKILNFQQKNVYFFVYREDDVVNLDEIFNVKLYSNNNLMLEASSTDKDALESATNEGKQYFLVGESYGNIDKKIDKAEIFNKTSSNIILTYIIKK